MSTTAPLPNPATPDLRALLNDQAQRDSYALNCHEVGQIVAFDATRQTATVQIMVLRILGGRAVVYPLLKDCPVKITSGGDGYFTAPIRAGDPCLVHFNDRDIDNWFTSGSNVEPNTARAHDLSDGFVEVGVRNLSNPIPNYSTTDTQQRNGAGIVGIGPDGKIQLLNASGSFLTRFNSMFSELEGLCDNVSTLCDNLTAWVDTNGDTPNGATLAAIALTKTAVGTTKSSIATTKADMDNIFKA